MRLLNPQPFHRLGECRGGRGRGRGRVFIESRITAQSGPVLRIDRGFSYFLPSLGRGYVRVRVRMCVLSSPSAAWTPIEYGCQPWLWRADQGKWIFTAPARTTAWEFGLTRHCRRSASTTWNVRERQSMYGHWRHACSLQWHAKYQTFSKIAKIVERCRTCSIMHQQHHPRQQQRAI